MKFVTVSKDSDIKLNDIKVDVLRVNNVIKNLTFTDKEGNVVQIMVNNYDVAVCIPEPPKFVEKFLVKGTSLDIPVEHIFDHQWQAAECISNYQNRVYNSEDVQLTIAPIQVEVKE